MKNSAYRTSVLSIVLLGTLLGILLIAGLAGFARDSRRQGGKQPLAKRTFAKRKSTPRRKQIKPQPAATATANAEPMAFSFASEAEAARLGLPLEQDLVPVP